MLFFWKTQLRCVTHLAQKPHITKVQWGICPTYETDDSRLASIVPKLGGIVAQKPTCPRHEMHIANTPRLPLLNAQREKIW